VLFSTGCLVRAEQYSIGCFFSIGRVRRNVYDRTDRRGVCTGVKAVSGRATVDCRAIDYRRHDSTNRGVGGQASSWSETDAPRSSRPGGGRSLRAISGRTVQFHLWRTTTTTYACTYNAYLRAYTYTTINSVLSARRPARGRVRANACFPRAREYSHASRGRRAVPAIPGRHTAIAGGGRR